MPQSPVRRVRARMERFGTVEYSMAPDHGMLASTQAKLGLIFLDAKRAAAAMAQAL